MFLRRLLLLLAYLGVPGEAQGQAPCESRWHPGQTVPGVNGEVEAMAFWDSDGPGPNAAVVVVGGYFTCAAGITANNIVLYDPITTEWSTLGTGLSDGVTSLTVMPNGDLVAGGTFQSAGGVSASRVARWNGSVWAPMGTGMNGGVDALAVMPNGDLIAGGWFTFAGIAQTNGIARWNGAAWVSIGGGVDDNVQALAITQQGHLIAAGEFVTAGGIGANRIARWDGTSWNSLGSGMNSEIFSLLALPNGDLIAGGRFTVAGGISANRIARWNGSTWSTLGTGRNNDVKSLVLSSTGDIVAGGVFTGHIARWSGTSWTTLGGGVAGTLIPCVQALLTLSNGDIVAGGDFTTAGGINVAHLARWNGTAWSRIGPPFGINERVMAFELMPNGDLIVGGDFTTIGGINANRIARWDGSTWSALGTGLNGFVTTMAVLPNGDLVAGGVFSGYVRRWNGTTWSSLGPGLTSGPVDDLVVLPNGDLWVAEQAIFRWNGGNWLPIDPSPSGVWVFARRPDGHIIAGGAFTNIGTLSTNYVARWDGSTWWPLGSGVNSYVSAVTVMPNGDVIVGGNFTSAGGIGANRIARWDGVAWAPLGSGMNAWVWALEALPDGDLIAGGDFTSAGGVSANRVARWDGTRWYPLALGVDKNVAAIKRMSGGVVMVGGGFGSANQLASPYLAQWTESAVGWNLIADCSGSCAPQSWIGDGVCDSGFYTYNGVPIYLDCPQFGNDGGDCDAAAPILDNPPNHGVPPAPPPYEPPSPPVPTQNKLILVTHGWDTTYDEYLDFWSPLRNAIAANVGADWKVRSYDWTSDSLTGSADWPDPRFAADMALSNALVHGFKLGKELAEEGYQHVHLIAHSAGSGLIATAAYRIKQYSPGTTVHTTFLDAFAGTGAYASVGNYSQAYGGYSDWSDHYYSEEPVPWSTTCYPPWRTGNFTQLYLKKSHNVDISLVDPDWSLLCLSTHSWPRCFFRHTVDSGTLGDCQAPTPSSFGYGFLLGFEKWTGTGGFAGWKAERLMQQPLDTTVTLNGDATIGWDFVQENEPSLNLMTVPAASSSPAAVQIGPAELSMTTRPAGELQTAPAWVNLQVTTTASSNTHLNFDMVFQSGAGAESLVTLYVNGTHCGTVDEKYMVPGTHTYSMPTPELASGQHYISFRLDPMNTIPSTVTIANVAHGRSRFIPACPADFNNSGAATVQDLFDFLAVWFTQSPSADFNNSGTVTVQDLFSFLAAWFTGCS